MKHIFKFLGLIVLMVSCIQKETSIVPKDGLVRVEVLVPQLYGHQPDRPITKAGETNELGDMKNRLPSMTPGNLQEGSTLWLTYELQTKADDPTTPDVNEAEYTEPNLKAYVVKSSSGGYQALYACKHSEVDGKLVVNTDDVSVTATPLYLKHAHKYRFRMISPAMPINAQTLSMAVDNGDSFCSSDQRYPETSSIDTEITANANGVNYISLNPMIQQTARLRLKLIKGMNVSTLDMMGDGAEITGIQNPYMHSEEGDSYSWSSLNKKDTLVMRMGDKRAWVTLPGDKFIKDEEGNLTGEVCILPTDARNNTVTILLNMAVNGVPTQYMTTLSGQVFEHAKSYNMNFTVSLRANVVVVNWQNVSWTENI